MGTFNRTSNQNNMNALKIILATFLVFALVASGLPQPADVSIEREQTTPVEEEVSVSPVSPVQEEESKSPLEEAVTVVGGLEEDLKDVGMVVSTAQTVLDFFKQLTCCHGCCGSKDEPEPEEADEEVQTDEEN